MDNNAFGRVFAEYRRKAGLSQRAVGRKADLSESKIRQLESGSVSMGGERIATGTTPATAVAAAHAVGMPAREALQLIGEDPDAHPSLLHSAPEPADDVVPGFSALTERQRDAVVALVESMHDPDASTPSRLPRGTAPADITARGRVRHRDENGLRPTGESDRMS